MSADWKAGDRGVCISDWGDAANFDVDNIPKKGSVYLVTGVRIGKFRDGTEGVCLQISGCSAWNYTKRFFFFKKRGPEAWWNANCFRKIVPTCDRASIEEKATA